MPEICPKIAQDISKICLRYAQALPKVWGFILRKWDKMSPGRVHQLGQYVSGEVHNAVGQFVLGTKCLLTFWFNNTIRFIAFLPFSTLSNIYHLQHHQVVQEYERAVIFRLGRLLQGGSKGPGLMPLNNFQFSIFYFQYFILNFQKPRCLSTIFNSQFLIFSIKFWIFKNLGASQQFSITIFLFSVNDFEFSRT